jgi:hypothetical protein
MNEQAQNNIYPAPTNKFKRLFVGAFILLLLSLGGNIAQAIGLFTEEAPVSSVITNEEIEASNQLIGSDQLTPETYHQFVEEKVKSKANWENDPNAIYMDYLDASFQSNESGMKSAYEKLSELNELGHFVDGRFYPLKNLELMQREIEASEHGTNESEAKG